MGMRPPETDHSDPAGGAASIGATGPSGPHEAPPPLTDLVFFDGQCGLCHASVQFVLKRERPQSARPSFAPLHGATFESVRSGLGLKELPDSLIVFTAEGRTLIRSDATLSLLMGLGGVWGSVGRMGAWCPRVLRDGLYRVVATVRRWVLPAPANACPVVPEEWKGRFLP